MKYGCDSSDGMSGTDSRRVRKPGCSSMDGMLGAMLLRWSQSVGTVEGGGDGSRGMATVLLGGDAGRAGTGDVRAMGSSETDAMSCWLSEDPEIGATERREGICDTRLDVGAGRGRFKPAMTSSHSLMGRSWLIRISGRRSPLFLRRRSSVMWFWMRCFESWR